MVLFWQWYCNHLLERWDQSSILNNFLIPCCFRKSEIKWCKNCSHFCFCIFKQKFLQNVHNFSLWIHVCKYYVTACWLSTGYGCGFVKFHHALGIFFDMVVQNNKRISHIFLGNVAVFAHSNHFCIMFTETHTTNTAFFCFPTLADMTASASQALVWFNLFLFSLIVELDRLYLPAAETSSTC